MVPVIANSAFESKSEVIIGFAPELRHTEIGHSSRTISDSPPHGPSSLSSLLITSTYSHLLLFCAEVGVTIGTAMTSTFLDLPSEVLHSILVNVDPQDIGRLSCCRDLNNFIKHDRILFKELFLRQLVSFPIFLMF